MRSLIKDLTAILIAGTIFLTSGWLFYNDINSTLKNIDGEEVGVIVFKKNSAQRKYSGRTVWESIETSEILYNFDTIRTTADSEAVILMNDGTEITLQDSSLIVLEWSGNQRSIEFLGGNISAKNSSADSAGVTIKSADTLISLADASVKLEKGAEGKLGLSVVEGSIGVSRGDVTQQVQRNQKALISRDTDSFTVNDFSIRPDKPDDNSYFLTFTNSQEILLSWETLKSVEKPVLEIAADLDFRKMVDRIPAENENNAIATLPEGTYYWRITSGTTGEVESQSRRFVVINDNYPSPAGPADNTEIRYRTQLPKTRFVWNQSIFPDFYLLEISMDENFSSAVVSEKLRANSQIINNLSEGRYFWRVTPHYSLGNIGFAQKRKPWSFTIAKNTELSPVSLLFPPNNFEINTIESSKGISFRWKEEAEISSYQFYFSDNPSFTATLFNEPLKTVSWSISDNIKPGEYYWRVGGVTADNEILPHSDTRKIIIKEATGEIALTSPPFDEHFEIPLFGSRTFTWDSNVGEYFRFSLYRDSLDTTPIIEDSLRGKSRKTLIPAAGDYFWQVSVIDEAGRAVIDSNVSRFSTRVPLEPPVAVYPFQNQEIKIIGEKPFVVEWEKVFGADFYSLEVENLTSGRKVLEKTETADTYYAIPDLSVFSEGNHLLKLKSYKKAERKWEVSESREALYNFTVSEVIVYSPPALLSPVENAVIGREEILSGTPVFEWQHRPLLDRYELSISDSFNFNKNLLIYSAEGNSFRLPDLKPGRYFWKIKGYDNRNYESPSSPVRTFTVEEIRPLLQPVIVAPVNGDIINMDNRNSLSFRWQPSPEAQYYSFRFYQEGKSGSPLAVEERYSGTDIEFRQLEKLDIGSFIFELQAFRDLPANERRSSRVSSSRFRVTLSQPSDVEIIIIGE